MSTLLANQGVQAGIAAILVQFGVILGIFAAYFKVRTTQAVQGEKIDSVEKQQAKQGSAVLVTPMPTVGAAATPVPVVPAPPAPAPPPVAEPHADVLMGHAAHLAAAQAGLQQAQDALALLLATPLPQPAPPDAPREAVG